MFDWFLAGSVTRRDAGESSAQSEVLDQLLLHPDKSPSPRCRKTFFVTRKPSGFFDLRPGPSDIIAGSASRTFSHPHRISAANDSLIHQLWEEFKTPSISE